MSLCDFVDVYSPAVDINIPKQFNSTSQDLTLNDSIKLQKANDVYAKFVKHFNNNIYGIDVGLDFVNSRQFNRGGFAEDVVCNLTGGQLMSVNNQGYDIVLPDSYPCCKEAEIKFCSFHNSLGKIKLTIHLRNKDGYTLIVVLPHYDGNVYLSIMEYHEWRPVCHKHPDQHFAESHAFYNLIMKNAKVIFSVDN